MEHPKDEETILLLSIKHVRTPANKTPQKVLVHTKLVNSRSPWDWRAADHVCWKKNGYWQGVDVNKLILTGGGQCKQGNGCPRSCTAMSMFFVHRKQDACQDDNFKWSSNKNKMEWGRSSKGDIHFSGWITVLSSIKNVIMAADSLKDELQLPQHSRARGAGCLLRTVMFLLVRVPLPGPGTSVLVFLWFFTEHIMTRARERNLAVQSLRQPDHTS